jgi:sec-independent protein translocase protein TatB
MPSFQDSIFLAVLALLLFGPKKLPELARYLGKLMGEFRRASNEFRMQMEDEFRAIEQAEQQKKIAAIEAAAPVAPLHIPEPEHTQLLPPIAETPESNPAESVPSEPSVSSRSTEPVPIASNGDLHLMPPSTGLPVSRSAGSSSLSALFDAIPHTPEPIPEATPEPAPETEATQNA